MTGDFSIFQTLNAVELENFPAFGWEALQSPCKFFIEFVRYKDFVCAVFLRIGVHILKDLRIIAFYFLVLQEMKAPVLDRGEQVASYGIIFVQTVPVFPQLVKYFLHDLFRLVYVVEKLIRIGTQLRVNKLKKSFIAFAVSLFEAKNKITMDGEVVQQKVFKSNQVIS
jgi:hypothetical protein